MDDMRVVIKPKGLIALSAVLIAIIVGVAIPQFRARSLSGDNGKKPVGSALPGAAQANNQPDDITPPEREEKQMLQEWNKDQSQARDWLFLGPLSAGSQIAVKGNEGDAQAQMARVIDTVYLPDEAKYQARENASFNLNGKTVTWRKIHGSAFDFKDLYSADGTPMVNLKNVVVYAIATIDSPKTQKKIIHFRSDDGAIVWLNGTQVFKTTVIRGVKPEDIIPITLRPGKNTLLVKVGQGDGGWGMMVHFEDAKGEKKAK